MKLRLGKTSWIR